MVSTVDTWIYMSYKKVCGKQDEFLTIQQIAWIGRNYSLWHPFRSPDNLPQCCTTEYISLPCFPASSRASLLSSKLPPVTNICKCLQIWKRAQFSPEEEWVYWYYRVHLICYVWINSYVIAFTIYILFHFCNTLYTKYKIANNIYMYVTLCSNRQDLGELNCMKIGISCIISFWPVGLSKLYILSKLYTILSAKLPYYTETCTLYVSTLSNNRLE